LIERVSGSTIFCLVRDSKSRRRLADEIKLLLGTAVSDDAATQELISRLCSDRDNPYESFVHDLAEILFLPREQRSEYIRNTEVAPPYRIGKLLLEYAVKARRIDELLDALTKGYCAAKCDRLPVGCCSVEGFDMGLVPEAMLELQEIEARRVGWSAPAGGEACKFHTAAGCAIALFKSPACSGMLCDPLVESLRKRHSTARLEPFLERLAALRNCDIDRVRVFEAMDGVIDSGQQLLRG
jgi:hypothetical protein